MTHPPISQQITFLYTHDLAETANNLILTLVVPSVDEWVDYLSARGVALEKPPTRNAKYKIYPCLLRDPNGYLIEIQHFLHPF